MTCRRLSWLLAAFLIASPVVGAAAPQDEVGLGELLKSLPLDSLQLDAVKAKLKKALEDPETLNKALGMVFERGDRWDLLRDLHLQFKSFNADEGNATGLGLSYQYAKDIKRGELSATSEKHSGLTLSFSAEGNVAFERTINPRDFLIGSLDLTFYRSTGGAIATTPAVRDQLNALETSLTEITDEGSLFSSPAWREFADVIRNSMNTQKYWDAGVALSYESNQDFTVTQLVYSGQLGFDLKAWNSESTLAQWNLFDFPAALVRLLDGVDREFTPRGSAIPTLMAGIDLVDPSENPFREALDEMDSYPRFRFESAYKSLIARQGDNDVFWLMDFRYYGEISPPDAIKAADQDEFVYFVTAVTIGESLFASYSDGQLPFDATRDKVYELGFQLVF